MTAWDFVLVLAVLIVLYAIVRGAAWVFWPRKLQPDDYEDPATWGSQEIDARKRRITRK